MDTQIPYANTCMCTTHNIKGWYITVIIGHYIFDVEWVYRKYTLEDRNTHWEHFGIDLGFKWEGHWMGTR